MINISHTLTACRYTQIETYLRYTQVYRGLHFNLIGLMLTAFPRDYKTSKPY